MGVGLRAKYQGVGLTESEEEKAELSRGGHWAVRQSQPRTWPPSWGTGSWDGPSELSQVGVRGWDYTPVTSVVRCSCHTKPGHALGPDVYFCHGDPQRQHVCWMSSQHPGGESLGKGDLGRVPQCPPLPSRPSERTNHGPSFLGPRAPNLKSRAGVSGWWRPGHVPTSQLPGIPASSLQTRKDGGSLNIDRVLGGR